jgi:hypothetical protein
MPYIESPGLPNTIADIPGSNEGVLDWHCSFVTEKTITNIDIERIRRLGGSLEVLDGYYWEETYNPFRRTIGLVTMEKLMQDVYKKKGDPKYNVAIRQSSKLSGTSVYGKMLEMIEVFKYEDVTDDKIPQTDYQYIISNDRIISKNSADRKNAPIQMGIFILAYSRDHMMNLFDHVGRRNVIATETDSMYIPQSLMPRMQSFIGKTVGALDSEFGDTACTEAYFLSKKSYGLNKFVFLDNGATAYDANGDAVREDTGTLHTKLRSKGIPALNVTPEIYSEMYQKCINAKADEEPSIKIEGITIFRRELFGEGTSVSVGTASKVLKIKKNLKEYKETIYPAGIPYDFPTYHIELIDGNIHTSSKKISPNIKK